MQADTKLIEIRIVLQNLLMRDADCRCGNINLTEIERMAIAAILNIIAEMK